MHKVTYFSYFHFPGLAYTSMQLPESVECLSLKEEERVYFSKQPAFCKIVLEQMTGNVVIADVDARMRVVLSEVDKHVPYWELVGITETSFGLYKYSLKCILDCFYLVIFLTVLLIFAKAET